MKINIKSFDVGMDVKAKGIEFEVRSTKNKFLGDCVLTNTKLIWCQGKTERDNGVVVTWENFIAICASDESLKAAIKAAKAVI